ncbi:hypothetical protein ACROYT_G021588 [Oculina patagonica]
MLTEVLLTVTNEEVKKIAQETYNEALRGPARQLQHSGGLDALRGKGGYLGLGGYGSDSESASNEESGDEKPDANEDDRKHHSADVEDDVKTRRSRSRSHPARAKALFRFTKRVVGKSIGGETGAKARPRSTEEDIGGITKRKADHEAGRQGNTAAVKRKERAKAIRRIATMKAELLVGTNRQNVVGNLRKRTRNIVGNEDLPVHRRTMNGTVRRTENVRRDHAVDHQGKHTK